MTTAAQVLAVAKGELGYVEGGGVDGHSGNITKYWAELEPDYQGEPWCGALVSWVFRHAGMPLPPIDHAWGFSYCPDAVSYYRSRGAWSATPIPGAIALYGFGSSTAEHTGIVDVANADGSWYAIEGNTSSGDSGSQSNGGGVYRRLRYPSQVIGFGLPTYAEVQPAPSEEDDMVRLFTHKGGVFVGVIPAWYRHIATPGIQQFAERSGVVWNHTDGTTEVQDDVFGQMVDLGALATK